ncbi:hypothetical protein E2986_12769 [Frieseomelitta varia]|uniref:Uncharacterized protein n=1 Tax=Frieseomelitta varia TaxID=561572 RepID=A0A833RW73_9HYME|nr:hypothetical protein E2986_12769 [Frieseomelitta varia]
MKVNLPEVRVQVSCNTYSESSTRKYSVFFVDTVDS